MSITKTPYDYGYYYLQLAKQKAKEKKLNWNYLSKDARDRLLEIVENEDSDSKN
tara:strand:+ start:10040 stop:10201 length:162 start_codon:yes stop_codon:yes gene_type:complete